MTKNTGENIAKLYSKLFVGTYTSVAFEKDIEDIPRNLDKELDNYKKRSKITKDFGKVINYRQKTKDHKFNIFYSRDGFKKDILFESIGEKRPVNILSSVRTKNGLEKAEEKLFGDLPATISEDVKGFKRVFKNLRKEFLHEGYDE